MRQDIEQLKQPSSVKETTGKQPAQPVPPTTTSTLPPPPPPTTAEEQSKLLQLQVLYSLLCNM